VRILVVDDEEIVRALTVQVLERTGYDVLAVASAKSALELLTAGERVDLVISDVVMPELSGVDLLAELREHMPDLPVILMTGGSPEPERTAQALVLGACAIVYKPYTHAELRDAVEAALAPQERTRSPRGS